MVDDEETNQFEATGSVALTFFAVAIITGLIIYCAVPYYFPEYFLDATNGHKTILAILATIIGCALGGIAAFFKTTRILLTELLLFWH